MRASRIIRYPIDIISVLVVLSTLSIQLVALTLNWPGSFSPAPEYPGEAD